VYCVASLHGPVRQSFLVVGLNYDVPSSTSLKRSLRLSTFEKLFTPFLLKPKHPLQDLEEVVTMFWLTYTRVLTLAAPCARMQLLIQLTKPRRALNAIGIWMGRLRGR